MSGETQDFTALVTVEVTKVCLRVCEACQFDKSHPGKSEHTDFEFIIGFLVKGCFLVVYNKNMSLEKV